MTQLQSPPQARPDGGGSSTDTCVGYAQTAVEATFLIYSGYKHKFLIYFVFIPAGIFAILAACFAVDVFFNHVHISFPASVACLLLLFAMLVGAEQVLGPHRTRKLVGWINIPAGWALRWINIFFAPSFVMLPLSPSIGISEVLKMIAVFALGFIIMMAFCAWFTRLLQLVAGTSKRSATARAEELHITDTDEIPITAMNMTPLTDLGDPTATPAIGSPSRPRSPFTPGSPRTPGSPHIPGTPSTHWSPPIPGTPGLEISPATSKFGINTPAPALLHGSPVAVPGKVSSPQSLPPQIGALVTPQSARAQRWASVILTNQDAVLYGLVLVFIGIPLFFAAHYAMPLHLAITILAFQAAMQIPATWRRFLHPVLISALFTVLTIWAFGAMRGLSLTKSLHSYKTGANYLALWESGAGALPKPGAGDIFSTVLDASIVALALPMYQYRRELREHFVAITVPNVVMSISSLFAYPYICSAVGIQAERALAFSARSLTLALALPAVANLGGDSYTIAAVAIMSGIIGVLTGNKILAWLKIPEDDYVTRGVTLGANSSALATAMLLRSDPRAAALSSLSMSLFGAITVLFTSIPAIVNVVRSLVGL
ncbi:hypothetical protein Cpir12675_006512 [Ceratocystis pirilliformis]|uniref:Plastidal glycolate/glycerate translocator 1, chloroplastic n=1 Tax=Ceratocystis pirilliformis TaxID=259994 RepID=A0ABR3YGS5_9PEZI